jgi:hypothetical protein
MGLIFKTARGTPIVSRLPRLDPALPRTQALRLAIGDRDVPIDADTPGTRDGAAWMNLG